MVELLVRVNKVLERHTPLETVVTIQDVVIDPAKRTVLKNGQEVYLKPMEFDCLMMFVRNKNKAVTRAQLLAALWGVEFEGFQEVIKTIPRIGYRLEVDG